jgi:hypothetical protein
MSPPKQVPIEGVSSVDPPPSPGIGEEDVVLLVVEEAVEEDAFSRRDRNRHALVPVPDLPDAETVDRFQTGMAWPGGVGGPDAARYHRVCVVAFPSSPVRAWVTAFFAAEVPSLVESGGLWWCVPPFDRRHVIPVSAAAGLALAEEWERLRPQPPPPAPPAPPAPKLHPGWWDRPGSGGWWSGPEVVVAATDPGRCHLRVREGRRSFCGRPAKELDYVEPPVQPEDVAPDRRCPECARLWWEEIRPERERERRDVVRRVEANQGLLAAFNQLDAINQAIADAPDRPAAHAALTAEPFGYSDFQAFHILSSPTGHWTAEARADLETQWASLHSWLARLDAFFAERPNHH